MVIKRNNGKAPARKRQPVAAPSTQLKRSPKNGVVARAGNATAESEAGDRVLAETEADSGMSGALVQQSELKNVSKDAFENTKDDRPNDADCGKVNYFAEPDGQLNLLEINTNEPPEPHDISSNLEAFKIAYSDGKTLENNPKSISQFKVGDRIVCIEQGKDFNKHGSILQFTKSGSIFYEIDNSNISRICSVEQVNSILIKEELEICNQQSDNGNGSICAQELAQDSPTQELNCGDDRLISSANEMNIAGELSPSDSPAGQSPQMLSEVIGDLLTQQILSLPHHPVNHSQPKENVSEPKTIETVSQQSLLQLESYNQNLQLSKTSLDFSTVLIDQEVISSISPESLSIFPRAGTMQNGNVSAAPILPAPGVEKDSLLLRSPGGLSGGENSRPPGKSRLETQLNQLKLIQDGEVVAPEFLELGYHLPIGFTNPQEKRTALELAQVQAQQSLIVPSSESLAETETTETDEKPSAIAWTGELPLSDSSELNICLTLPPNIGRLGKAELISMAQEQHQLICVIERKEFELALEKLHRIRLTGVYLQEFKKKCQYGEFVEQLEQAGIGVRSAQSYMAIAKNWEIVESKAKLVALLTKENQPTIGLKWALEAVRDEKKQLKSAAPPKDPDSWATPNTKEQPIVALVQQALGGQIWLDPCSGSLNNIPCGVRYYKHENGLLESNTWSKTVFVNPPFSEPLPWVKRCCFEFGRGNVGAAIMLLKAGTLSNVGTGELINKYASAICHWRGRIDFLNEQGNPVKGSDFDCIFVYFGSRFDLFRQAFGGRGTISTVDNYYSSANKKFLQTETESVSDFSAKSNFSSIKQEQKQLAVAVGLGNGRSVLPDLRDADRALAERYDPHTVVDVFSSPMPPTIPTPPISENLAQPIAEPEVFDETPLVTRQIQKAKENTLNDYVTAISGNITEFSDEQLKFLLENINKEVDRRNN